MNLHAASNTSAVLWITWTLIKVVAFVALALVWVATMGFGIYLAVAT